MQREFADNPELAAQWALNEQEEIIRPDDLTYEAQCALLLFNILPDKVEGMSGAWLGKDYSGLFDLMTIYSMSDKADILEHLQICIHEASEYYSMKRKQEEQKHRT